MPTLPLTIAGQPGRWTCSRRSRAAAPSVVSVPPITTTISSGTAPKQLLSSAVIGRQATLLPHRRLRHWPLHRVIAIHWILVVYLQQPPLHICATLCRHRPRCCDAACLTDLTVSRLSGLVEPPGCELLTSCTKHWAAAPFCAVPHEICMLSNQAVSVADW
jgi:hypothetical protein